MNAALILSVGRRVCETAPPHWRRADNDDFPLSVSTAGGAEAECSAGLVPQACVLPGGASPSDLDRVSKAGRGPSRQAVPALLTCREGN